MLEEKFFARKRANTAKLTSYGFAETSGGWRYVTGLMNGALQLEVLITSDGKVTTRVTDTASGEEYTLYKVSTAAGAYVGAVRAACEEVLADIARSCFEPDVFRGEQTLSVMDYVRKTYGSEPEYLWEKFPDNAIWRRQDNRKWFGLLVALSKRKLGLDSDDIAEMAVLRLDPGQMDQTVDRVRYFPGWHMSKKNWYTILLDGSVPTEELCRRIDESRRLAAR